MFPRREQRFDPGGDPRHFVGVGSADEQLAGQRSGRRRFAGQRLAHRGAGGRGFLLRQGDRLDAEKILPQFHPLFIQAPAAQGGLGQQDGEIAAPARERGDIEKLPPSLDRKAVDQQGGARARRLRRHRRKRPALALQLGKIIAGLAHPRRQLAEQIAQERQAEMLVIKTRLQQLVEVVEGAPGVGLQAFEEAQLRRRRDRVREARQPACEDGPQAEQQQLVPECGLGRTREGQPFLAGESRRKKFHSEQRHALDETTLLERV
jgi:hypothetical protein